MLQFSYSPNSEELNLILDHIDTDKSGAVELSEFIEFIEKY
jgi:Ca2+-binding EF-hand superfamily protein